MAKMKPHDKVNKSNHSLNPDRENTKGKTMRTKSTIRRLNMYRNFKAQRNKDGKITRPAPFQNTVASGSVARVEPNRRWFGNTRVISQDALQNFKEAMKVKNPYEIVMKQTTLPVSLLDEKKTKSKSLLLAQQSYSYVFGKNSQRKRPSLSSYDLVTLSHQIEGKNSSYSQDLDKSCVRDDDGVRDTPLDPHFRAGQSKRLWGELFKVLDSSDVVLYVLDARDPMGTRSKYIEKYMRTEKPHKHFIFVLNKVDLVPVWITKRWKAILSRDHPTLIFHANQSKPLGKVALIGLLRQFFSLHAKHRPQISVGIIGYPNVGKSSIINALRNKKVCSVAPIAGQTKVWQYVNLMKSIFLIDCPGVVYPDGASEAELVLKGVVRVEHLRQPDLYIADVLARVQPAYLQAKYSLPPLPLEEEEQTEQKDNSSQLLTPGGGGDTSASQSAEVDSSSSKVAAAAESSHSSATPEKQQPQYWNKDPELFLELISRRSGKLLKGGEPDVIATAKRVLNDFQRGKLPYFVKPLVDPEEEKEMKDDASAAAEGLFADESEELIKDLAVEPDDNDDAGAPVSSNTPEADTEVSTGVDVLPSDDLALPDDDDDAVVDLNADLVDAVVETERPKQQQQQISKADQRKLDRALRKSSRTGSQYYAELRQGRHGKKAKRC